MVIYNTLIIVFTIYYTFFFYSLFFKQNRQNIKNINTALDEKRKIPVKTLEQQKEFLTLKNGIPNKWKFTWKGFIKILIYVLISILLFKLYSYILSLTKYNFQLWQVILIFMFGPIIINFLLKKFHLEQNDLGVIMKWRD